MPVQEKMLEDDYIDDVEHHEWGKIVLDGTENKIITKSGTTANYQFYTNAIPGIKTPTSNGTVSELISTHFVSKSPNVLYGQNVIGIGITTTSTLTVGFGLESQIDTIDKANQFLQKKYNAGTSIILYYKLAEPKKLELTEEQKKVREQIEKEAHTYKNITHIHSTDEVSPILDVEYVKDLDTVLNNLANASLVGGN